MTLLKMVDGGLCFRGKETEIRLSIQGRARGRIWFDHGFPFSFFFFFWDLGKAAVVTGGHCRCRGSWITKFGGSIRKRDWRRGFYHFRWGFIRGVLYLYLSFGRLGGGDWAILRLEIPPYKRHIVIWVLEMGHDRGISGVIDGGLSQNHKLYRVLT